MSAQRYDPTSMAGKLPSPERHAQLVVVGAGPAGVAAALEAAKAGLHVLLIDENPVAAALMGMDVPLHYGQRMSGAVRNKGRMLEQLIGSNPALADAFEHGVDVELGVYAWGAFVNGPGVRSLPGPLLGLADEERSWLVGFDRLIVASGARDLGMAFPGWDRPGVMGVNAAHSLMARYGSFAGRRVVILGSTAIGLALALSAIEHGLEVAGIVEVRAEAQGPASLVGKLRRRAVPILTSHAVKEARGGGSGVASVILAGLDGRLAAIPGSERELVCDTVCLAIGSVPNVELLAVLGCELTFRSQLGGHVPALDARMRASVPVVFAAGDCAGVFDDKSLDAGIASGEGRVAALAAAASLGAIGDAALAARLPALSRAVWAPVRSAHAYQADWLRASIEAGGWDVPICLCEEVTRRELVEVRPPRYLSWGSSQMRGRTLGTLLKDGPVSQDQIKRLTRAGMGHCQGRRCREQITLLLAMAAGTEVGRIPLATYRPPLRPLPLNVLQDLDECPSMRDNWEVWFGIPTQWTPFWDIGTPREPASGVTAGGADPLDGK